MIWLDDDVYQRVQKLAERKCMSVHKLCSLYIEMAVCWEELQAHNTAVSLSEHLRQLRSTAKCKRSCAAPRKFRRKSFSRSTLTRFWHGRPASASMSLILTKHSPSPQ
jgi:hypothetical protein